MYTPKYLNSEQLNQIYGQAMGQAEAAVAAAWINCVVSADDPMAKTAYEQALAKMRLLEEDLERLKQE